jgi:hypothetical protein
VAERLASAYSSSLTMPVGVKDAGDLTQLGGDQAHGVYGQPLDVDLDADRPGGFHFGDDPTGQDVEVLKALENACERARIRLSGHL